MERLKLEDLPAFYEKNKRLLWSFLCNLTGSADEAEDLVQTTFLQLIDQVEKRAIEKERAGAYLFRMAHHAFIDRLRSQRTARQREAAHAVLQAETDDAQGDLVAVLDDILAPEATNRLTNEQKEILRYRLYSRCSNRDVAEILQLSRRTYYRRLEQALVVLRQELIQRGQRPEESP